MAKAKKGQRSPKKARKRKIEPRAPEVWETPAEELPPPPPDPVADSTGEPTSQEPEPEDEAVDLEAINREMEKLTIEDEDIDDFVEEFLECVREVEEAQAQAMKTKTSAPEGARFPRFGKGNPRRFV